MALKVSGTIRKYVLIGVGVAFLEEVCYHTGSLIYAQDMPSEIDHLLLPVSQD